MSNQPAIDGVEILQEWEGYVVEVVGDEFVARLVDVTAGSSHEDEEAIIPVAEVSDIDAVAPRVGSIFRWVIGYECSPSATKECVSRIAFRDLRPLTDHDFQRGRRWAREMVNAFNR